MAPPEGGHRGAARGRGGVAARGRGGVKMARVRRGVKMARRRRGGRRGRGGGGGSVEDDAEKYKNAQDAKELLDMIGKDVYDEVHKKDADYRNALHGLWSNVTYPNDKRRTGSTPPNPCELNYKYHTNVTKGHGRENPCKDRWEIRFSDKYGGQCTNSKIHGNDDSNGKDVGACAPFRRLHLCDQHLAHMEDDKINTKDNLLLEVCLAAKYEGKSLVEKHKEFKKTHNDSNICTILARSFADIGDIIRGKDLFRGDNREKKKLEKNLQNIFKQIYNNLMEDLKKYPTKSAEAQKRYKDDAPDFYQLREDWWDANRLEVWKAITCGAPKEAQYFRKTCSNDQTWTNHNCHCAGGTVPTYFDYVPQYLRWFDEWADDFCRKRNNTLKLAKKACRNESKQLYCSHNGFDCTKRIEKGSSCSRADKCTECSTKCIPYEYWLEKQQNEFNMQKDKYDKEIEKYVRKKDNSVSNINYKYYKEFYEELKKSYKSVHDFLTLLNKGSYCKEGVKGESTINFNKTDDKGAFDRSEYCQPCPNCVVQCKDGNCTEDTKDNNCRNKIIEQILRSEQTTEIDVLINGNGPGVITEKFEDFCSNTSKDDGKYYKKWKCYNKNNDYNNCEMNISSYNDPDESKLMVSVECFDSWARNLLIDTIKWEHQLKDCINNTNVTDCKSKCNSNCKCYEKWIKRKEHEWKQVKEVLNKKDKNAHNYYNKLKYVFDSFLFPVMNALNNEEKGKWDQFTKDLEKKFGPSVESAGTANSQDAIKLLLDHLKDNATICKDNNTNEACDSSKKVKTNPCGRNNNGGKLVRVKRPAEMMQRSARKQLEKGAGETKLKGDATRGKYTSSGSEKKLDKICDISLQHSNRNPGKSEGPCHGKNTGRFDIGKNWTNVKENEKTSYSDVYLPQRREHMCTSNLEYLETGNTPFTGSDTKRINDSFLGDVLLSAKYEAENIKKLYEKNKDQSGHEVICRAVRYSFADLGDIIRGRDMWDKDEGSKKMDVILKNVFGTLHKSLEGIRNHPKYAYDKNNKPPYKQLREDWWEANRHQVWRAMKCAIEKDNITKCNGIPIEDYIPQRLRWMVEWAEWYCKAQNKYYGELETQCDNCKNKNDGKDCTQSTPECALCKAACKKYGENIKKWEKQWEKIKEKYEKLYKKALDSVNGNGKGEKSTTSGPKDENDVVDFLKQLLPQNSAAARVRVKRPAGSRATRVTATTAPITLYSSAAGYIHQELGKAVGCNTQKEFCDSKNGKYAFKDPPTLYKEACKCENNTKQAQKKKEEKTDACIIATNLVKDNNGKTSIHGCGSKTNVIYPEWKCHNDSELVREDGVCMPPRRQKLCLFYLTKSNNLNSEDDIRKHFITCAAIETYFAWERYKEDNTEAEDELQKGIIPEGFKRQMFYTFGDYRDIFFGTDISSCLFIEGTSNNIKHILNKEKKKHEEWWNEHGKEIWEGMLCALTNGLTDAKEKKDKIKNTYSYDELKNPSNGTPSLEEFAERPQFLRWFTEWGEHFCKEQKKQFDILKGLCNICTVTDNGTSKKTCDDKKKCDECKRQCQEYQKWLKTWKENYKEQKKKFLKDKKNGTYKMGPGGTEVNIADDPRVYLDKQLKNMTCTNGLTNENCEYTCMDTPSSTNTGNMPESLDEKPKEVKGRCTCQKAPQPPAGTPPLAGGAEEDDDDDDEDLDEEEEDEDDEDDDDVLSSSDEDEEEEEEEGDEDGEEDNTVDGEETQEDATENQGGKTPKVEDNVNPCQIVQKLFENPDDFKDVACNQKYGAPNRYWGWKCISDTTTGKSDGSICIPPRRRRLYVTPLTTWASGNTAASVSQGDGVSTETSQTSLLHAFVKSAAVETFFLWHKYKAENTRDNKSPLGGAAVPPQSPGSESDDNNPQNTLLRGKIPPDFLRLMFYTLGDYRDILFSGSNDTKNGYSDIVSGDNVIKERESKIQEQLKSFFSNSGSTHSPSSVTTPQALWSKYAEPIWNGMICALTHKTETPGEVDDTVKEALLDANNKPKNNGQQDYTYENVKLDDTSDTQAKTDSSLSGVDSTLNTPKLSDFVKLPPFFRWLHEWGSDFCGKRARMLEQLEKVCRGEYPNGDTKYCSGDGNICDETRAQSQNTFISLHCSDCLKECMKYKKWIDIKFEEYHNQKSKYEGEFQKIKGNSNGNNNCCKEIQNLPSAAQFLKALKHCKDDQSDRKEDNDDKKNNKIDFSEPLKTFSPTTYCKACPIYGVICNSSSGRRRSATNGCTKNTEPTNNEMHEVGDSTPIDILINDGATKDIDEELRNCSKKYSLFKGLSKQEWKCQKINGVDQCKLTKPVAKTDDDKNIWFNEFFQRWLRNFVHDYNKLKHIIHPCIKKGNGKEDKCIKDCNNKCECVGNWLKKKEKEWGNIKKHYNINSNDDKETIAYRIKSYFEQLYFDSDYKKAQEVVENESDRYKLWGCTGRDDCTTEEKEKNDDFITNLIDKLQEKIGKCKTQHSDNPSPPCVDTPPLVEEEINPIDDDTDTTDIQKPLFCPTEEEKEETLCDDKQEPKCDNFKNRFSNSTCEPKKNLIGLNAHNRRARTNSNMYISPRVKQLCLQPLHVLEDNNTKQNELIEALKECAYNEGKGLYEYYNNNKSAIGKNDSVLLDKDVETYTLEAMKRSYADYSNIVKDDVLWNYQNYISINNMIFSIASKSNKSQHISPNDDDDVKRQKLWESIRTNVWKSMLCGYKDAGGAFVNEDIKCKLPDTENTYQFFRWFEEWGQNFCIRHEQELKRLKEKCDNVTCNGTDETKKKECKMLCESYKQFLSNSKTQYENQKKEYEIIKSSYPKYEKKDAFTFLKDKCNSKCLCFKDKSGTYFDDLLKNLPDDVKDQCDCKTSKAHDDKVNDLDKCPNNINNNKNICNKYKKRRMCGEFKYNNSLDNWYGRNMLIPPRRRHLCLRNIIIKKNYRKGDISKFKDDLLSAAASEAKFLFKNYEDKNEALQAIKYTFADIGDIIKGKDMMDDTAYKKINIKLQNALETTGNVSTTPEKWWEQNRKDVWEAMLCAYKQDGREIKPNDCNIPTEENTHQFLRWLTEWGTQYCKEKEQLKLNMQMPCKIHFDKYGIIEKRNDVHPNCLPSVEKYEVWSNNRLHQWKRLSSKFDEVKGTMNENVKKLTAYEYLKQNCSKCICSFKDIEQTNKKSKDEGYHIYEDILDKAQIPSFLEDTAYRYKGLNPECPEDIECSQYGNIPCSAVSHDDDNDWNSSLVRYNKTTNWGVLLPPRRRQLCLRIDVNKFLHLRNDINNLKTFICKSAFAEAKRLKKVYKDDNDKLLQAMKYSFADIGSIVKGEDMKEGTASDNITKIFNGSKYSGTDRKTWWDLNKYHVWESMLCGYKEAQGDTKTSENCRFPDIETVPQFLRWFQEWTEIFCIKRKTLYDKMVTECQNAECVISKGSVDKPECTKACEEYKNYVLKKKKEYYIQKDKYDNQFKKVLNNKDAPIFLNVHCLSEYFSDSKNWENPYDTFDDDKHKDKCDCKKIEHPPPVVPDTRPPPPPPKSDDIFPPPADEPFDPTILQTTIPFGVALALGSIAFLFLKKKTQAPVELFSVINIPKSDYDIPTLKSSNRYIPYASDRHKGKTYIYMEGDSDEDKYAFMSDTTDVTSSESEYEELDINDIYVPGSPKYKTLIEVVLEPSKRDIQSDDIPSSDIPMNKFTDDEWNQLKKDFISNMLQNQPNDVTNDYKSGDIPLNTQPNTLYFDKPDEKPFITSIHDRNLYSGEEYSYNVNMVNSMNDIPINSHNNVYSGIDLINDSLNSNNVDIYDEILKRKENELFGTNHVKHTNTHNVAKPARDDPIHNQLELFHKWLDRHRDMCEKWENHHERLAKLKEEWDKDNNNSGNINPSGNTPPTSDIPSGKLSDTPSDNNIHSDIHPSDIPSGKQSDIPKKTEH
ncbi:hypothetical protein PFFCH_04689 [Plasmodium falciparum FCH/4]|uniref:Duffy-binding-like domain-containing protein n=1 Tax=Plasmodium falciparum FCH/4 TaxID=1036724 RepID=A0A024VGS0_PLAFA|nr:hypothetical protein PFFCH_04689 [Plasmodium falciparum FCH/4]